MLLLRRPIPAALLGLALAAGCATTPPPAAAPPPAATATPEAGPTAPAPSPLEAVLPPLLRGIDLTPAQAEEVLRLNADLETAGTSFVGAVSEMGRSVAGAARKCKGDTPFIEADALRVVREGEAMRARVLDAAQHVHRVLTPAQRKKVSDRLVEGDDWAKRERRNSQRTKELGPILELSTMQTMQMLVKAGILWTSFADRAEPWRDHYRAAITHFARDDFDAHHEPVAAVPVVAFFVDFVRAGLRQMIPILEPKQCEALADLIDQKVEQQNTIIAERAAQRAKALEQK